MTKTPLTQPTPAEHQQMNRSNDPEITQALDEVAPDVAMDSRRQRFAGEAQGVGSVGFDEIGAYDVGKGAREPQDEPVTDDPPGPAKRA